MAAAAEEGGGAPQERLDGTCMELALEGERLCKAGNCKLGVQFFEAAVQVGTDDLKTLSAIYSQMGNAYFYLQEYGQALEYHKHDYNLARTINDRMGEAKASGNLGNTLKVLGKFGEAVVCCQRHLDISRDLNDRIGEARALYNLGNVFHAKGKHAGRSANQDPGDFPPDVKMSLQKAAQYYEQNVEVVRELGDRAAQGRACGNLGNTHYLLGNFSTAIRYHEERLAIAREFGDKSAERRAYSNLGNAHIFLGEFEVAAEHYKKTLQLSSQLGDRALEAQACYSLGNTYTLLKDYETAIDYHIRHLKIAMELRDRVGEGRACWSLGNAHASLGNHDKAMQYAVKHLDISQEIGDQSGQMTAEMNLTDLRSILGIKTDTDSDVSSLSVSDQELVNKRPARQRRLSMENLELVQLTPDKAQQQENQQVAESIKAKGGAKSKPRLQKALSLASDILPSKKERTTVMKEQVNHNQVDHDDDFFDLLSRFQSRRIDDQRCSIEAMDTRGRRKNNSKHNKENKTPTAFTVSSSTSSKNISTATPKQHFTSSTIAGLNLSDYILRLPRQPEDSHAEEFLDMVAGIQGSRMNDQRADLPVFPGLNNQDAVIGPLINNQQNSNMDDQFFEMLMRCQSSRLEDQRSSLPRVAAPTVPDEDFFTLIQRIQSNRLDEQRTQLPLTAEEFELQRARELDLPLPHQQQGSTLAESSRQAANQRPGSDSSNKTTSPSEERVGKRGSSKKSKKEKKQK